MIEAYSCEKGSKITRLVFWKRVKKNMPNGIVDFVDNKPKCPKCLEYLWDKYDKILSGCDKVGWVEIASYQQSTNDKLNAFELKLLIESEIIRQSNGN